MPPQTITPSQNPSPEPTLAPEDATPNNPPTPISQDIPSSPAAPTPVQPASGGKSYLVAFVLSLLFGSLGVDRFYLGKIGTGVLKFLTLGGLGIWTLIDLIRIYLSKLGPKDGSGYSDYPAKKKTATIILIVVIVIDLLAVAGMTLAAGKLLDKADSSDTTNNDTSQNIESDNSDTSSRPSTLTASWEYSLEERALAEAFVGKYNNEWFSRQQCSSAPVDMYDVHIEDYQVVLRFRCQGYQVNGLAVFERSHTSDEDYDLKMVRQNEAEGKLPDWVHSLNPTFYDTVYYN